MRLYGIVRVVSPPFDAGALRELVVKAARESPLQFELTLRVPAHEPHHVGEVMTFVPAWLD